MVNKVKQEVDSWQVGEFSVNGLRCMLYNWANNFLFCELLISVKRPTDQMDSSLHICFQRCREQLRKTENELDTTSQPLSFCTKLTSYKRELVLDYFLDKQLVNYNANNKPKIGGWFLFVASLRISYQYKIPKHLNGLKRIN